MADTPRPIVFGTPMLPDRALFTQLVDEALDAAWLSNGGALHARLEQALSAQIGAPSCLVSSGTMALMIALRLGDLPRGAEVITSPLSYAASVQAIEWCGLTPVFADVLPDRPVLCPQAVARAITPRTGAILGVHFLGVACDVSALEQLAAEHGLWLVFDAAQTPDVQLDGQSLCQRGDVSALSLHATKLLNTAEGGAVIPRRAEDVARIRRLRHFGLDQGRMTGPGINGKLSEINAAFGLAMLPQLPDELAARARLRARYDAGLEGVRVLQPQPGSTASHLYYTLDLAPELARAVHRALAAERILARAPFPLLCGPGTCYAEAPIHSTNATPLAPQIAPRLLSLPMLGALSDRDSTRIIDILRRTIDQGGAGCEA